MERRVFITGGLALFLAGCGSSGARNSAPRNLDNACLLAAAVRPLLGGAVTIVVARAMAGVSAAELGRRGQIAWLRGASASILLVSKRLAHFLKYFKFQSG